MKKKKLYIIMLILSFIFASFSYEVQANSSVVSIPLASGVDVDVDTIFKGSKFFDSTSGDKAIEEGTNLAAGIINNAIAIVQIIGLGIAMIMLFSLGMKYMVGSVEEKAEVKKHAMVYVIGAVIFFSATGILEILQMFIQENFKVE